MRCVSDWDGLVRGRAPFLIFFAIICLAILVIILVSVVAFETVSNPKTDQYTNQVCAFVPDIRGKVPDGISFPVANVSEVHRNCNIAATVAAGN